MYYDTTSERESPPTVTRLHRHEWLPIPDPRIEKEKRLLAEAHSKEKRQAHSGVVCRRLAVVPLGTLTLGLIWLLQQTIRMDHKGALATDPRHTARHELHSRVIHLTLANTDRKARIVLPGDSGAVGWDDFLVRVQTRLRLNSMSRIETAAGETIVSVGDLMNGDNLVIYADEEDGEEEEEEEQQQQQQQQQQPQQIPVQAPQRRRKIPNPQWSQHPR